MLQCFSRFFSGIFLSFSLAHTAPRQLREQGAWSEMQVTSELSLNRIENQPIGLIFHHIWTRKNIRMYYQLILNILHVFVT